MQVEKVKKEAVDKEKARRKKERALEAVMLSTEEKGTNGKRGLGAHGGDDAMDIDDEGASGRVTRGGNKRGAGGFNAFGVGRRLD